MPRSPPAAVDSPPQSPSPHKIRNASLTKRGKPRKEKQIPTKHERLYWAQMRIGQMPDEALLQTLSHKHQIHEMRWCNADDTAFYVFMRREMVAREGMWTKICAQFGGEYVPNPEVPKYQLWKHFAAIWGEPQSAQLHRNKRFFTEKSRSSYRADPDDAERKPRPNVIGELNPLQSKASVMAIRSLIAPEGAAADTSEPMLGIAEAVMNAVYVVDPSKVPPAQGGKDEEEPAVPTIDEDDIIIPDSADEDDGKPRDYIEAGARAMRELHALVTGGKKNPAKRRRLVQRHITDTARRIEPGAAVVAPVTSSTHPRWTTPVACMPKHKRIQYRQVIATPPPVSPIPPPPPPTETVPFVELARAFLMHPDIYAIDIQTDILHVIHQFIPEASRSAAAYFDVQNVKSVLGRLFPRGATSYESYLTAPMTQSRELTTVEAHRRALRLEDMCVYLVNTLRATVGGDDALPSLSHADAADVCVALEYHGGVHGNGKFYWLGRPETQDVLSLAKLHQHATGYQSTLRPTLDYLRDNRAKAFERTYVVADIQSWALPFILEMFSVYHRNASQPPMGHATFVNAIADLNRLRVQVRVPLCRFLASACMYRFTPFRFLASTSAHPFLFFAGHPGRPRPPPRLRRAHDGLLPPPPRHRPDDLHHPARVDHPGHGRPRHPHDPRAAAPHPQAPPHRPLRPPHHGAEGQRHRSVLREDRRGPRRAGAHRAPQRPQGARHQGVPRRQQDCRGQGQDHARPPRRRPHPLELRVPPPVAEPLHGRRPQPLVLPSHGPHRRRRRSGRISRGPGLILISGSADLD